MRIKKKTIKLKTRQTNPLKQVGVVPRKKLTLKKSPWMPAIPGGLGLGTDLQPQAAVRKKERSGSTEVGVVNKADLAAYLADQGELDIDGLDLSDLDKAGKGTKTTAGPRIPVRLHSPLGTSRRLLLGLDEISTLMENCDEFDLEEL